jgi:phage tail tape-measure protein
MTNISTEDMDRHVIQKMSDQAKSDLNADPISGAAGSHPIGTGIGATSGAVVGAVIGSVGGPIGAVVGAVIGTMAGGLAGHSAGEAIDPTKEEVYWREAYLNKPYYEPNFEYDRDYYPAYRLGYESRAESIQADKFDHHEEALRTKWESSKADSQLSWEQAKPAARDAWERTMH